MKKFSPDAKVIEKIKATYPIDDLSKEVSVYAASPEFVKKNCGDIANLILDSVPENYFKKCEKLNLLPNIDVRVHRLNKGEYPAVPGWHCDGALRETYFSSPDLDRVQVRDTVVCTVSSHESGVSNFEIIDEDIELPINSSNVDFGVWAQVNKFIEEHDFKKYSSEDGKLYQITVDTLHRCMPAKIRGWRLFFRMSMWHNPYLDDYGKISIQQQVYIKNENGW